MLKPMQFKIPVELERKLRAEAKKKHTTMTAIIVQLLVARYS